MTCKSCRKFNMYSSSEIMLSASGGFPSTTNGAADPVKTEFGGNGINMYFSAFDQSADEYMEWTVWMPDTWDGKNVSFSVCWTAASGTGDVIWGLQGRAYANDDAIDQAWGSGVTVTDTFIAANDVHFTEKSTDVTLAGTPASGQLVQFRLYRDADVAGDTLNADALLISAKIYYNTL